MDDLRAEYRRRLTARIEALDAACAALANSPEDATAAIRRLAHTLRGSGATFGFPVISEAARAAEEAPAATIATAARALLEVLRRVTAASEGAPPLILIVDDDPAITTLLERAFADTGWRTWSVGTIAAAEDYIGFHPVALVVLDLLLPDGDGRALISRLRTSPLTSGLPVLVLSGRMGRHVKAECFALGADAYFEKPPDVDLLRAAIAGRLARPHGAASAAAAPAADDDAVHRRLAELDRERVSLEQQLRVSRASLSAAATAPAGASGPPRVLVAEDDPMIATIVQHRLERAGFEVTHCRDGAAALAAAQAATPVVVILDVKMPAMDGFEVLRRLRDLPGLEAVPILMLTSLDGKDEIERAFALGADDYVLKPFDPAELVARVRRLASA